MESKVAYAFYNSWRRRWS